MTSKCILNDLKVHPSGQYLYAVVLANNAAEYAVFGYSIDSQNGALTTLPGSPFGSPFSAIGITDIDLPSIVIAQP